MAHILIVNSRYYEHVAEDLEIGATAALQAYNCTFEAIDVPGALEIPAAIRLAVATGKFDGYIALGCVIRGETSHYDIVCRESAHGLSRLSLEHAAPIGNGILTCENMEQARARAGVQQGNKGRDAAIACLTLVQLKDHWGLSKERNLNAKNA